MRRIGLLGVMILLMTASAWAQSLTQTHYWWTPQDASGVISFGSTSCQHGALYCGEYVVTGNVVTWNIDITWPITSDTHVARLLLPTGHICPAALGAMVGIMPSTTIGYTDYVNRTTSDTLRGVCDEAGCDFFETPTQYNLKNADLSGHRVSMSGVYYLSTSSCN